MELPKDERTRIKPGTALRVTEVGDGLYVTPLAEPTEKELREVIAAAGSLAHRQTPEERRWSSKRLPIITLLRHARIFSALRVIP